MNTHLGAVAVHEPRETHAVKQRIGAALLEVDELEAPHVQIHRVGAATLGVNVGALCVAQLRDVRSHTIYRTSFFISVLRNHMFSCFARQWTCNKFSTRMMVCDPWNDIRMIVTLCDNDQFPTFNADA